MAGSGTHHFLSGRSKTAPDVSASRDIRLVRSANGIGYRCATGRPTSRYHGDQIGRRERVLFVGDLL